MNRCYTNSRNLHQLFMIACYSSCAVIALRYHLGNCLILLLAHAYLITILSYYTCFPRQNNKVLHPHPQDNDTISFSWGNRGWPIRFLRQNVSLNLSPPRFELASAHRKDQIWNSWLGLYKVTRYNSYHCNSCRYKISSLISYIYSF